jgi:hypothetical protein
LRTLSVSVSTTMPSAAIVVQLDTGLPPPSTWTTQTRQAPEPGSRGS